MVIMILSETDLIINKIKESLSLFNYVFLNDHVMLNHLSHHYRYQYLSMILKILSQINYIEYLV